MSQITPLSKSKFPQRAIDLYIDLLSGYPFKSDDFTEDRTDTKLLRGINVTENLIRSNKKIDKFWSNPSKELEKYYVQKGDLVISMDGSKVGRNYALVSSKDLPSLLVQRVARIRAKNGLVQKYLHQLVGSKLFLDYVESVKTSSGIPHISAKQIKAFTIPMPSTSEQEKIAEILSTFDKKTELIDREIELTQELKKGLMSKLLSEGINGVENLEKGCIGDFMTFSGGAQPPRSSFVFEETEGYIRLIQIRDYKSDRYLTYIQKEKARKFCSKTDVMIGRYGPPIFQILRGIEGAYNVALMKAIPSPQLDRDYMYHFLKQDSLLNYIESFSQRTSGQTGIEMDRLREFPLYLPTIKDQKKIVEILDNFDHKIDLMMKQKESSQLLKKGLMQKIFNGELSVSINKSIEEQVTLEA
jgi:type I restriction enzyme S subunit